MIPQIRGKYRSRPMENILQEAEELASKGCREVILIAQDVTEYGRDLYGELMLAKLLRKLCRIEGLRWIRLMYCYEDKITDELIEVMASEEKICHYIDIPLQHISDHVLSSMNRHSTTESIKNTLCRLRKAIPDIHIRTTLITGFPGETEEDFQATLDVVEQARFSSAFTFLYSPRPGTPAADREDQVPDDVALERYQRLIKLQERICAEDNAALAGTEVEVLVSEGDGRKDGATHRISGRARDNRLVHVALPEGMAKADRPRPGDMIRATVTYGAPHHLIADSGAQGGLFEVRRTRAGDAWEARQASDEPGNTVSLGIPTLRVGAPS